MELLILLFVWSLLIKDEIVNCGKVIPLSSDRRSVSDDNAFKEAHGYITAAVGFIIVISGIILFVCCCIRSRRSKARKGVVLGTARYPTGYQERGQNGLAFPNGNMPVTSIAKGHDNKAFIIPEIKYPSGTLVTSQIPPRSIASIQRDNNNGVVRIPNGQKTKSPLYSMSREPVVKNNAPVTTHVQVHSKRAHPQPKQKMLFL